jgi:hypothetical protein
MATLDDVTRLAAELPDVSESEYDLDGHLVWRVAGKRFAWEREFSETDIKRYGDQAPPNGPILAVRVADLKEREAILGANTAGFFTIHHFSGYKAYLIQLEKVSLKTLREAITDAWLAEAPIGLTRQYSRDH